MLDAPDYVPLDLPDDDSDPISALLAKVLAAPSPDQPATLERLCARHPACAPALQLAYGSLQQLDLLQVAHAGEDPPPPSSAQNGLPRTLGTFRLLELLGAGGMGAVYRAEDTELGRQVALKLIRGEMLASERTRTRFQRESAALARLDHPGLCTVYRSGSTDGQPWIAMRLVTGTTLAKQIAAKRQAKADRDSSDAPRRMSIRAHKEVRQLLQVFEKIARALATAHAVGVVHRDLKPANIVLTGDSEPVVIDFGLVHLVDSAGHLTLSSDQIGTPAYMAPEQVERGDHEPTATTDVYSLGVTLFEALTLESPYLAHSREELFLCIVRGKHRRLRQVRRDLPAELELVLEKALDREPARRYASMSEFAEDLRRFCAHEPLLAAPPSAWYRFRKLARRYPGPVLGGGAVFLTAVVGAVVVLQFALGEQAKVREFDLLSGIVGYEQAIEAVSKPYPPWPHKIATMERWLKEDAGRLLAMQPEIERTVRDLEVRALPPTEEELAADRRSHPRFAELELLEKRLASLRYAQAIRDGKPLALPSLTPEQQALDAQALEHMAWQRVAPRAANRTVWAEEALGLAAARLAAAKGKWTAQEYEIQNTLSWAELANGQDAAAREASEQAFVLAPKAKGTEYEKYVGDVNAAISRAGERLQAAVQELAELTRIVSGQRTYRFELESQRFLHDVLADLLDKLSSLAVKEKPAVEQRLLWAKQIRELTLAHPNAEHTWTAVRPAVASSPKYAGRTIALRDDDVLGLVPIGENPVTHLWEFYELRSAWDGEADPRTIAIPRHEPDGSIKVTRATGIVFVLLPGGTFTMGAQRDDPNGPNYDLLAEGTEVPHTVTLPPFFIARHELTRAQWHRLAGEQFLWWQEGANADGDRIPIGPTHPAESMDWDTADLWLRRHGLELPTEEQWEYGCRAGTTTRFWSGSEAKDLQGCANVHDRTSYELRPHWGEPAPFTDGFAAVAPVGSFRANGFGLYDVHGNVWEWCRDLSGTYAIERGQDGPPPFRATSYRAYRGSSCFYPPMYARSAYRYGNSPTVRDGYLGVRPARLVHPVD